jgi:hypothetical protein
MGIENQIGPRLNVDTGIRSIKYHDAERARIESAIDKFLSGGGKIDKIPTGVSGDPPKLPGYGRTADFGEPANKVFISDDTLAELFSDVIDSKMHIKTAAKKYNITESVVSKRCTAERNRRSTSKGAKAAQRSKL